MNFSALILAGGRSHRMGRDKAFLELDGQPLLARQVALAQAAGASEVFISGRPEADYSAFRCPVLLDEWPGCGPLGGIERGLATATHPLLLVLAVDLPCLGVSLLNDLLGHCTAHTGVVPRTGEGLEPLVAAYPKAAHALAREQLQARQYAACAFAEACVRSHLVVTLRVPDGLRDFTNWNSPEALALSGPVYPPHAG